MRDMRVALDLEEARHVDRSGDAHTREVVATQVDEHHVLCTVLLGIEQPLGVARASLRRARDRVEAGVTPLALDERLRRRADQRDAVELEQEEVRRRVDSPERAVELDRARRRRALGPLRYDDLERVSLADVLLRRAHG